MTGFSDVGVGNSSDDQELARKAGVVLSVGLKSAWKLPVGNIFPSSTPQRQSQLITRVIEECVI